MTNPSQLVTEIGLQTGKNGISGKELETGSPEESRAYLTDTLVTVQLAAAGEKGPNVVGGRHLAEVGLVSFRQKLTIPSSS